ncbi:MAG: glycine cleavage system aminomethyltransferase GcvT [Candidatus Binataceae bacterium]
MVDGRVKRTPLYDAHRRLGARMVEFGGFAMPLQYRGILGEHRAVRQAAGLFDLSHMGEFELRGARAVVVLERALTNAAARLLDGQAHYTIMCADDGGTLDDLIVYRRAVDDYMLCVNAANIAPDWERLAAFSQAAELRDVSAATALIALQGPRAAAILGRLTPVPLATIGRFRFADAEVAGIGATIARTGYTGEDGFEIFVKAERAAQLFAVLLEAGAADGLEPCGLGARDTLRMEAGLPLYGHELDRETSPLEAGLGAFVKFGRGFAGEAALAAQRARGLTKRLVGIRTDDAKSVARRGYALFRGEQRVGAVTSGTYAPSFARPLAMGYVAAASSDEPAVAAAPLEVEIRGRRLAAALVPLPFYRREKSQ